MSTPARPTITVAVVMQREAHPNRWEDWRHSVVDVVLHEDAFGTEPHVLRDDGRVCRTLHPGFAIELFHDEGEGYYLNLSSGAPAWFVVWRADDEDPSRAWPETVSVSYNEAGRWLDAQEHVEQLPMPADAAAWLQAYTDANYRPEPKQRRRPQSFLPPQERRS
jgi:hypothetical protein